MRTGVTVIVPHDRRRVGGARLRRHGNDERQRRADRAGVDPRGGPAQRRRSAITNTHRRGQGARRARVAVGGRRTTRWRRSLDPARRGRDVRRPLNDIAGGHVRAEHVAGGARRRQRRPGRRGQRGRRDGNDLPRVQGRHRDRVAARRRRSRAAGPSACSCRRTTAGAACCASTACRSGRARSTTAEVPSAWDEPRRGRVRRSPAPASGSIIGIVATDAPLLPHQCARLARRAPLGVARVGRARRRRPRATSSCASRRATGTCPRPRPTPPATASVDAARRSSIGASTRSSRRPSRRPRRRSSTRSSPPRR